MADLGEVAKQFGEIADKLDCYVYRIVDPRDGITFYIGKGKGTRMYAHEKAVKGNDVDPDEEADRSGRIRQIQAAGLEPIYIVHRHGMNDDTAYEVEAALIDAYPGLTNLQRGHHSDKGVVNAEQLIKDYKLETMPNPESKKHKVLCIRINSTSEWREDIYERVRWCWKLSPERAEKMHYVFAVERGVCQGVFVAKQWRECRVCDHDKDNIRYEFVGGPAPQEIQDLYMGKRLPEEWLPKPGAANPISYRDKVKDGKAAN